MQTSVEFVTSAADTGGFPRGGLKEVAVVGRSNVGKSSLINALVRQTVARTSAAPGKTRLANYYRVRPGRTRPFYLVDLPGYGYARGGANTARVFAQLAREYFDRPGDRGTVLLVDARHPGLSSDLDAWHWITATSFPGTVVATKVDKLTRAERSRNLPTLESLYQSTVLPVSARTGEGLDELWKLIVNLPRPAAEPQPRPPHPSKPPRNPAAKPR